MKKIILSLVFSVQCLLGYSQGTFISVAGGGTWANAGTWTLVGGSDADGIPDADDVAYVINTSGNLNITSNVAVKDLHVIFNRAENIQKAGFFGPFTVTIHGQLIGDDGAGIPTVPTVDVVNDASLSFVFDGSNLASSTTPVITTWGNIATLQNLSFNPTLSSTTLYIDALSVESSGTLTVSNGSLLINNSNAVQGAGTIVVNAGTALTIDGSIDGGSTSTNFPTVNIDGTVTVGASGYFNANTINLNSGGILNVQNNEANGWWNSAATGPTFTPNINSTVNYNKGSAQGIAARDYGNLNITSGGGTATKTLSTSGTLTILGDATIGSSTTFSTSNNTNNITFQGGLTNDGIFTDTRPTTFNGGGTQVVGGTSAISFSNTVTISNAMDYNTDVIFSSTVSCGSNNMSFAGNFTNDGTFNCSGVVTFDGALSQSIAGASISTFNNLTISNTASTVTINGTGSGVTGTLILSANSGFNANGLLTLVSDAGGTARVEAIPPTATFSGNVIYQRYISGAQQWHNIGVPVSGLVTDITGSGFTVNGNDLGRYNESVAGDLNQGWETSDLPFTTIDDTRGYSLWTRTADIPNSLEFTGLLNTGSLSLPISRTVQNGVSDDGWNLVNNPYASQIDGNINNWTSTGLDGISYVWDPTAGGGAGAYITNPSTIASGQSFWVHANAASPTLVATQSIKASSAASFYRIAAPEIINELSITLVDGETTDLTKIIFKDAAAEEFDTQYDGYKLQNGIFNLSSLTEAGLDLSINNIPMIGCSRIVKLNITNINEGGYQLKFDGLVTFDLGYEFVLKDNFLGTNIILKEGMLHDFFVTADAASWGNNRFEIALSAANLDAAIVYEVADECNFASSVSITNAQVGVSYSLVQNGNYLTTQIAASSNLLLPLAGDQVISGLNQFDLEISNGSCGNVTKLNAIEFTVNPVDVGTIQYESNVECDLITNVTVTNAQIGVTYTLIQNGITVLANEAITNQVVFTLSKSQVIEGLNQFDLDVSNGSCPNALAQNAIEFTIAPKQEISLVADNESCGAGQVLLKAEGATGSAYYNWYESFDATTPIPDQINNEFLTPLLETTKFYYVAIANEVGCESSERVKVTATIKAPPSREFIYETTDLCDLSNNLVITNAIIGATYILVKNGTEITRGTAIEVSLELSLDEQKVVEGANKFDVLIEMNGCTSEVPEGIEFNYYSLPIITVNNYVESCENSSVMLVADGAKPKEHYNWYESVDAVEPIPNEVGPEFLTPELAFDRSYFVSIVNENGCETSREQVEITVIYRPIVTKNESKGILSTLENENYTYKWYKEGDEIVGETKSSLVLLETGNYEVEVLISGCSQKSDSYNVDTVLGLKELEELGINIYPNPVVDKINITNGNKIESLIIYDTKGVAVYRSGKNIPTEINLTSIRKGIYIINIATENKSINYRFRKQ